MVALQYEDVGEELAVVLVPEFVAASVAVVELAHVVASGVVVVVSFVVVVVVVMSVGVVVVAWAEPDKVAVEVVDLVKPVVVIGRAVEAPGSVVHAGHYEVVVVVVVVLIVDDVAEAAWAYGDAAGSCPLMDAVLMALGLDDVAVVWSQLRVAWVAWDLVVVLVNACVVVDDDEEAVVAHGDGGRPALASGLVGAAAAAVHGPCGPVVDDVVAAVHGLDGGQAVVGPFLQALAWPGDDVVMGDAANQMDDRASSLLAVGVRFAPTFCRP